MASLGSPRTELWGYFTITLGYINKTYQQLAKLETKPLNCALPQSLPLASPRQELAATLSQGSDPGFSASQDAERKQLY